MDPARILDVLALSGDASDNIPGIPGVGPKTATTLIQNAGTLDKLFADLAAVKNEKLRAKLAEARDQVFQNREMVRLDHDLPLPVPLDELRIPPRLPRPSSPTWNASSSAASLAEYRAEAKNGGPAQEAQDDLFPF